MGLLVLRGERDAPTPAESRILRAFGDQLALVLERDRLLRAATGAEVYRQTERLRQTLLAAVSHDLRSPLAAIKANVTDLLDAEVRRTDEEQREVLEEIDSEAERLNALIANLLDMSRIEAGVLHAHLENVDLGDAVATSVGNIARVWPTARIRTRIEEGDVVRVDRVFLDRVLTNLLDNAIRAGNGTSSDVEVTARSTDGRVTIRVIDHGRGSAARRPRGPVPPLLRSGSTQPEARPGSRARDREGLRGRDGRGDLGRGDAGRRGDVRDRRCGEPGRDVSRILVVDDEVQILRALRRALAARGHEVVTAAGR